MGIIGYTILCIKKPSVDPVEVDDPLHSTIGTWLLLILGILLLYFGYNINIWVFFLIFTNSLKI